ncbi:MAG: hypothetical protein CMJ28_02750 [Phycisphaerae bacterium]|nr:hypothetical protein [Phycisphaerae bacterium]
MATFADSIQSFRTKLGALDPQARMLAGMGAVFLVGVVWFAVSVLQGDVLVPVGLKHRDPTAFQIALTKIQQAQITHEVRGDNEIYVSGQDRALVEARLAESGVLDPKRLDMESAIGERSPFESDESYRTRLLVATQNRLSSILANFDDVSVAEVVIAQPSRRGLGRSAVVPTASVQLRSRSGEVSVELATSAAGLVAGAVPGLALETVRVTDAASGILVPVETPSRSGSAAQRLAQSLEDRYESDIKDFLSDIPGVKVLVRVTTNADRRRTERRSLEDGKTVEMESTESSAEPVEAAGGTPGIRANTGSSVSAPTRVARAEREQSRRMLNALPGESTLSELDSGTKIERISCFVRIPRAVFEASAPVGISGNAETDAEIKAYQQGIETDIAKIQKGLEGIIPPEEGTVEVVLDDLGRRAGSPLPSNGVLTVGEASGFAAWTDNLLAGLLGVAVLLVLWRVLASTGGGDAPADSTFLDELELDEAEQVRLQDIEALIKENPDEAVAGFLGLVRGKEPAA